MANGGLQNHGTAKREAKQVGFFESEMLYQASVSHVLKASEHRSSSSETTETVSLFGTSWYTASMEINKEQKHITSNSLISTPASVLQRRIALIIGVLLALVVLLAFPYAHQPLPHFPVFIAVYCSLAMFADLITAYLLFGQFFRTRSPSLLALATTYFFSGLIVLPYVLSFPGLFSATGLLHAGTQTANWLWVFWHTGFPLGILFSVLLDKKQGGSQVTSPQLYRQFTLVLVLLPLLILLLSIVAITSNSFLPILIVNGDLTPMLTTGVGPALLVIAACACLASLFRTRRGTVMQVWLSVATLASLLDVALVLWAGSRYSVGWYLARVNTIITATVVLCALLYQVNRLYEQIVDQVEELFSLKEANRVRDQFFSKKSHELRTPLTSIIGFSEMLLEETVTAGFDQVQQNNLERILKNGQHLLGLINDVLDLSKMEAGRMAVPYSQVDVRKLLTSVVEETQSMAIKQHLVLRAEVEEGIDSLESNPMKLHQILLNLVSNALKFTKQGEVTISARRVRPTGKQAEQVAIAVKDSGMGIPADIQERIFEAFYQADGSYTRKFGGTGLGLSFVRQLTTLLGEQSQSQAHPGRAAPLPCCCPSGLLINIWSRSPHLCIQYSKRLMSSHQLCRLSQWRKPPLEKPTEDRTTWCWRWMTTRMPSPSSKRPSRTRPTRSSG